MATIVSPWALVVALTVSLAAAEARANPDVWVETTITVAFDDQRVSGLEFSWIFDDFYSARTIQIYDLDRDGALNPLEVKNLRAETFDPLSHGRLFRSRLVGRGATRQGHDADRFSARIEETKLIYEFSVALTPPLDPKEAPVTVSLFDRDNVVDFNFSDSAFLLVSGEMTPGCTFSVEARQGGAIRSSPTRYACL